MRGCWHRMRLSIFFIFLIWTFVFPFCFYYFRGGAGETCESREKTKKTFELFGSIEYFVVTSPPKTYYCNRNMKNKDLMKAEQEELDELRDENEEVEPEKKDEAMLNAMVEEALNEEVENEDGLTAMPAAVSPANARSKQMINLIQAIDRKIPLDDYAEQNQFDFDEVLSLLEHLIGRGTKLDIQYFIDEVMEKECQEELFDYFDEVDGNVEKAIDEFYGIYQPEEVRLARLVWKK